MTEFGRCDDAVGLERQARAAAARAGDAPDALLALYAQVGRRAFRHRTFANARTMRNLFEDAIAAQAQRLGSRGAGLSRRELMTLEAADLGGRREP